MAALEIRKDRTPTVLRKLAKAEADTRVARRFLAIAKLYDRKTPFTAADLMNDRVVPFFDEHEIAVSRVLTDRGTEFCGEPEAHEYDLYLAIENIDHTRTKARSPQTNGTCERFHEPCSMSSIAWHSARSSTARSDELQADLDAWLVEYNEARPHQGRWCYGKTLYEKVFCARGKAENLIKDMKRWTHSDKTAGSRWQANQFRLFLHMGAYWLLHASRRAAPRRSRWRAPPSKQSGARL